MDLDAPIISGLRPGHRRGNASPSMAIVVVSGDHHSSHQRSPSATPDMQLTSEQPSSRTGRNETVKENTITILA